MLGREPYRLFFPLGLLLAAAGVTPWILFARGALSTWPGVPHALVMSQGFFMSVAIGFLATMGPRRTGTPPLSSAAIGLLAAALAATGVLLLAGATAAAEGLHALVLAGLAVTAFRRMRASTQPLPPSFVLMPIGVALAAAGAALLIVLPELALGRALAAQALMICLVLAVAPILVPTILGPPASFRVAHLAAGLLVAGSFAVEQWISTRAGLWLRGAVCAYALAGAGALAASPRPGLHRALFRLALLLVPLGLLAAGAFPERRIALLHITYAGGFAGLIMAVTIHVSLFHAGRGALADRWPALALAAAACLLGAVSIRTGLEGFGDRYLDAMVVASSLWLGAVAVWAVFLFPHLRWRRS